MIDVGHAAPQALQAWAARTPLAHFTDDDGAHWSYRDNAHAGPKPPLVLLPGALGNGDTAWQVAEAFEGERRVITVTYPGGRSAGRLASGLADLLHELGTGAAALWGSSYGAWWVQAFAAQRPENVAALWLGNTFVDGDDVAASPLFNAAWLDAATSDEVMARWHAALSVRPDDALRAVQLHMLHHGLPAQSFHHRLLQVTHAAAMPPATNIANTVVCDCADDPTIAPAVRERVRARYPDATQITLAAGGHYPHIVAPAPLIDAMRGWLA
ncbi:MAG: alpha/beta hydrolase [Variovorax sp.]